MNPPILVDTHVLPWAAGAPERLSARTRALFEDADREFLFSAASVWEVAIKAGLGRSDFSVDPRRFRRGLIDAGYRELPVLSEHAVGLSRLPPLHRDPFDRMLLPGRGRGGAAAHRR